MTNTQEQRLSLPDSARRLGMDLEALLDLIYDGKVRAQPDRATGRLLLSEDDVKRLQARIDADKS